MKTQNEIDLDYEKDNESDEDSFEFTEIYIKKPFYDWKQAQKEFGLAFSIISDDGFDSFVQEKFLVDFITLRKCFILRDYSGIRFWIHKFKGSFKLFYSMFISKPCEIIISHIDKGQTFEIENLYCNFVVRMEIFIEKLAEFSRCINNPIKPEYLDKLRENLDFCDHLEDAIAYNKILEARKLYLEGKMNFEEFDDFYINVSTPPSNLCAGCSIL